MLNEIKKLAYCSSCGKNVPHSRRVDGVLDGLLQTLRIGPWICLNCQRKQMVLPSVRDYAADLPLDQIDVSVDTNNSEAWTSSRSAEAEDEAMASSEWDFSDGFGDGNEQLNSHDESAMNGGARFIESLSKQTQGTYQSQVPVESQIGSKVSMMADEQPDHIDVNAKRPPLILEEADRKNSVVPDSGSTQSDELKSEDIPEAEPVGNFIKDQSLVLKSARLDRFTEKFRDSVVERILAGKVAISSLTEDGQYSESELLSWIADKAKRQNDITKTKTSIRLIWT